MNSHSSPATKILTFFQSAFKNSKSQRFSLFPNLPLEIRLEIWRLSLPRARVLQVTRTLPSSTSHDPHGTLGQAPYKVRPVSYGGHQIPILSVNRESRAEALRYLTLIWGTYWNLELDAPYFEIRDDHDNCVTLIPELRKKGELDRFKHIAIDWMLWDFNAHRNWNGIFRPHQLGYEHPSKTLGLLPNIKTALFVLTEHKPELKKDLVKPYVPWRLGTLSNETCLRVVNPVTETRALIKIKEKSSEWKDRDDLEIKYMSIHDREREYTPQKVSKTTRNLGWDSDFFG